MLVLGLTGGISSGKSTVAKWFRERSITVLDADEMVRDLQKPGSDLLCEIAEVFGKKMILEDGNLVRKKLAHLIFQSEEAKKQLNIMTHPKIKNRLIQESEECLALGEEIIVLDIPLLYEGNFEDLVSKIVVVYVPVELQVQRLMKRDQIDEDYALQKINSQLSLEEKKQRADYILDNSGTLEALYKQCELLLTKLKDK